MKDIPFLNTNMQKSLAHLRKSTFLISKKIICHKKEKILMKNKKPYKRTENAVIMAAGLSSRFAPLSWEKPKGLLVVKGEVLIERQIQQLLKAGITDITIVVGYKKELFMYLEKKFGVTIIENPDYSSRNNHSSLYHVRDRLSDTYVCSADNYFSENVFKFVSKEAYYSCVYEKGETEEWCVLTDETGLITEIRIGGKDSWVMMGHVFFSDEFSKKIVPLIEETYFNKETADFLWEEIYRLNIHELPMYIRPDREGIVFEFDSLNDLRLFDSTYENETGSKIMKFISEELNCEEREIHSITPCYQNREVVGFKFLMKKKHYMYRYRTKEIVTK